MSKFTKIASVLALSLGAVGTVYAAIDDQAQITGLRWVADLTTQVTTGNMVIVDNQNNIIGNSSEFELRGVQNDLSIVASGADSLFAKSFTDGGSDGLGQADGIAQQEEVDLDSQVSATWALTDAKYEIRTASGQTIPTEVEPEITFSGTAVGVDPSGNGTAVSGVSQIDVSISAAAPTTDNINVSEATQAIVTLSILATQDA